MNIICLCSLERTSDSRFDNQPYIAYLEPAWAGNHISEATLLISDIELEYYEMPVFTDCSKARNHASQVMFGCDA
jgi:hypothetical protein